MVVVGGPLLRGGARQADEVRLSLVSRVRHQAFLQHSALHRRQRALLAQLELGAGASSRRTKSATNVYTQAADNRVGHLSPNPAVRQLHGSHGQQETPSFVRVRSLRRRRTLPFQRSQIQFGTFVVLRTLESLGELLAAPRMLQGRVQTIASS